MNRRAFAFVLAFATLIGTASAQDAPKSDFFTTKDGVKIHYLTAGTTGSWVVLIHGFRDTAERMWFKTGIAPEIAKTHRVVAIDNRNHGLSDKLQVNGRGKVEDVVELMDHLKIGKAHIHGYSMGASMTAMLLTVIPDRFITAGFGGWGIPESDPRLKAEAEALDAGIPALTGPEAERMATYLTNLATTRSTATPSVGESLPPIDLSKFDIPMLTINGSADKPYAKSHKTWREARVSTNIILDGMTHLSAISANGAPPLFIKGMAAFINGYDVK